MTDISEYTMYIAIGPFCWGRADNIKEAADNCFHESGGLTRKEFNKIVKVYLVTEDTEVSEMGGLRHPMHCRPITLAMQKEVV